MMDRETLLREVPRLVDESRPNPLHDLRVGGVDVWPIIRIWWDMKRILAEARQPSQSQDQPQRERRLWQGVLDFARLLVQTPKGAMIFLQASTGNSLTVDGKSICPHNHAVMEVLNRRFPVLMMEYASRSDEPRQFPIFRIIDTLVWLSNIFAIRCPWSFATERRNLRSTLSADGLPADDTDQLIKHVMSVVYLRRWFGWVLQLLRPRALFVLNYYSRPAFALVSAARDLGIVTIDLQHGSQGPTHLAYKGYHRRHNSVPAVYWCWTAEEANCHQTLLREQGLALHVHYPAGQLKLAESSGLPSDWEVKRRALITVDSRTDLEQVKKIIQHNPSWGWLIRLHPSYRSETSRWQAECSLVSPCVNVQWASTAPMPVVLKTVEVHLTHYSGAMVDARLYSVPTIVFDPRGLKLNPLLVEAGWVHYSDCPVLETFLRERRDAPASQPLDYLEAWDTVVTYCRDKSL